MYHILKYVSDTETSNPKIVNIINFRVDNCILFFPKYKPKTKKTIHTGKKPAYTTNGIEKFKTLVRINKITTLPKLTKPL